MIIASYVIITIEADLVPLYLQTASRELHGWELLQARLQPGDVLHSTIPAKHIERLWGIGQELSRLGD